MVDTTKPAYGYVTPAGGFTLEAWYERTAAVAGTGNAHAALFVQRTQAPVTWSDGEIGRYFWFGFSLSPGGFWLIVDNEGGGSILNWNDPSPSGYNSDNTWHHVALTLDAATMKVFKIFLDGVLYTTQTASAALDWLPGIMTLAGSLSSDTGTTGFNAWDQRMGPMAVFNKELTANKIQEHYAAGSGGTVFYGDDENERLARVMGWADVPPSAVLYEDADTLLEGLKLADSNALDIAHSTAGDAGGYLFADGQAIIRKHNRRHRYNRWAELSLGEASNSTAPEIGFKFQTYQKYIYNDIRGKRPFGTRVRLQNIASQDANGRKVYEIDISVTEHEELVNAVLWILTRYGTDTVRISGAKFQTHNSLILKELAYGRIEIGDMLVLDSLPDPSPEPSMEFIIESISVDADFLSKTWEVELKLSPNSVTNVFQLCSSTIGDGSYVGY